MYDQYRKNATHSGHKGGVALRQTDQPMNIQSACQCSRMQLFPCIPHHDYKVRIDRNLGAKLFGLRLVLGGGQN